MVDDGFGDSPPIVYEANILLPAYGWMAGAFICYTVDAARQDLVALRVVALFL